MDVTTGRKFRDGLQHDLLAQTQCARAGHSEAGVWCATRIEFPLQCGGIHEERDECHDEEGDSTNQIHEVLLSRVMWENKSESTLQHLNHLVQTPKR